MIGKLLIARHHESEWNKLGLWTGSRDVHLTPHGFEKSLEMGLLIKDIPIDSACASTQSRSQETLTCMLKASDKDVPVVHDAAHNERDYGDYTGKNKWEVEKLIGDEKFQLIRRGWDYPIPNGETLEMVYQRVVPFFKEKILPLLLAGQNVLLVSHGNAIRALTMYLENIPKTNEGAAQVEMLFGQVVIYDLDEQGQVVKKEVRTIPSDVSA